jgi:hypothetical protein
MGRRTHLSRFDVDLEGRTNLTECVSLEALFKGESTVFGANFGLQIYAPPNEDFGGIDNSGNPDFEGRTLKGREYSKYIENLDFIFCQSLQNLRLGSISV